MIMKENGECGRIPSERDIRTKELILYRLRTLDMKDIRYISHFHNIRSGIHL